MNSDTVTRRRRLAAGAVALALVTAACGSDEGASDASTVEAPVTAAQEVAPPTASIGPSTDSTDTESDTAVPAAEGAEFVTFVSDASFTETEDALNTAIVDNGMMVLGDLNQAGALSATGLQLEGAHSYFVGNPGAGKTFFEATPAIGAVIPLQMHVWTDDDGIAYVSYFDPTPQFEAVDELLVDGGGQMAQAASMIAAAATGNADAASATVTGGDQTHEWIVTACPARSTRPSADSSRWSPTTA